jgi:hypothetical protein
MLVRVELRSDSISLDELVIVRHLGVTHDVFITMVFFGDHPDVRGSGNVLGAGWKSEEQTRKETESLERHRGPIHRIDLRAGSSWG